MPSSRAPCGKLGRALDGDDLDAHRLEQRGGIASARAHDERTLAALGHHFGQELTEDRRRGKEAAAAYRHRPVGVCERPRVARQELLARHGRHRLEHGGIAHALRPQLAFDHRGARSGEIGNRGVNRHCCYMPLIHLEFKACPRACETKLRRSYRQVGAPTAVDRKTSGCETCVLNRK